MSNSKPYHPVDWDISEVMACKAMRDGVANEGQQKIFLDFLINKVCATYDLSYRENTHDTAFAEGRRFTGLQIVKLVNMSNDVIERLKTKP